MIRAFVDVVEVVSRGRADLLACALQIDSQQMIAKNGITENGVVGGGKTGWNENPASVSARGSAIEGNDIGGARVSAADDVAGPHDHDAISSVTQWLCARSVSANDVAHDDVAVGQV